ncbi:MULTISPECIES: murein L,D-transpeptidase [unclassified Bradyrhizobium]|uniref:L,D-transpeptidase family protein n=1 Tax=unclassified Bradyrhizobium TaxID=2631580 RepID=UPI0029164B52|nr:MULTISPECIES: L,D-transpeptidase family protein [unclassified Bradyrhizobium]
MAVAATFLAVSSTSAFAQSDPPRSSAAELAIDAAIPFPEPANVPPPTASDFKLDTTATVSPDPAKAQETTTKPLDSAAAPAADPAKTIATPPAAAPATATVPEPVKAASTVPAPDQPVADRLRDLMATKATRYFDRKAERAAVEKFYTGRDYAPIWTQGGNLTAAAKGVIARLKDAAADGLNPGDYPVPDFAAAASAPDALAEADLRLTESMMDYARQAQSGRMHWSQVSADIQYPEHPIDPNEVLANVTGAKDASAALESYNPPHRLYKLLKAKLAELRGVTDGAPVIIDEGQPLKYTPARGKNAQEAEAQMSDPRVPKLRAKLGLTENADDIRYDAKVAAAVRKFQESVDLKPTGVLDDRTVKALNTPKRDKQIDTVLVNMERWRWLPRDLGAPAIGDAYVILNIPDYTLKVMQHGAQVWTTRVVTGKPGQHATPLLSETMKFITVNPTWNVPPSIIYNEYLPALQQDPTVLDRMGLRLERARDGSIHISQPPGEANALGRIRFNFPNKFLVYQHDTPDKNLFARDERAFSHGCMRVQYPDQYASVLLNITMPNERYTPERIRSMYGRSEIDLKFPTPIPVNITYQTAFVDDAGKLQFRKDIYGRDATMIAILKNNRGKDLENVVAHAQPSYARPKGALPNSVSLSDNSFSSGPNFFERLFGGGGPPTPPAPVGRPARRVFTR